MTTNALTDGLDLVDPGHYGRSGPPHDSWTALRRHDPLHRCENDQYPPFWAVTKHSDIMEISTDPGRFLNEPGIVLLPLSRPPSESALTEMRTIIQMDPPEHRTFRKVASAFFTPKSISQYEQAAIDSARSLLDDLAAGGREGEVDLAAEIATSHPLRLLSTILGIPRSEEPTVLRVTNQLLASDDEDLQRKSNGDREAALAELGLELYTIFEEVLKDRRANPRDDLISIIANAKIDGEPMGPLETFGYCLIVFTAGHDTTKNALAGGLDAFVDHPEQLAMLRANPDLAAQAVDEVVRWSTPVNYMMRTAAVDTEVAGKKVAAGDNLLLFYASANRDEDLYADPFAFRIDREDNRQIGFGIGEHFCLGAHFARMSQRALYREFAARVEEMERTAPASWISSSFVVGYKHVPVRYRLTA